MITKQEFVEKIGIEARNILTGKEYDDYRQAQIDDDYYSFTDGRKVSEFLDGMYPVYVARLEAKMTEREFCEYRGKFLSVLSDESVTDSLIVSYRIMRQNEKAVVFEGYIRDELKKHKSGENRVLKFLDMVKPKVETQETKGLSIVMKEENETGLLYSDDKRFIHCNDKEERFIHCNELDSLASTSLTPVCSFGSFHATHVPSDREVSLSHTMDKPLLSKRKKGGKTQEPKEYKKSEFGFDMSEFTSGTYLPWKKSRDIEPVEGVKLPDWLQAIPTPISIHGYTDVEVHGKLETCLRQAWDSPEWQANPFTQPRPGRNIEKVKQTFIEQTMYLYAYTRDTRQLPQYKLSAVLGAASRRKTWLELIQTPYTTTSSKTVCLMKYTEHGAGSNKPNMAAWDPYLYESKVITKRLTTPTVLSDMNGYYNWAKRMCASHPVLLQDHEAFRELDVPTREVVEAELDRLVASQYEYKGRFLTTEAKNPRPTISREEAKGDSDKAKELRLLNRTYVYVEDWLQTYDNAVDPCRVTNYSKHRDRHYGPYIGMATDVRKLFTWKGKRLTWLDYASMHPTLLLLRFCDQAVPEGHEEQFMKECKLIDRILGVNRDYISTPEHNPREVLMEIYEENKSKMSNVITCRILKVAQLSYYNQKISVSQHTPLNELYELVLPMFSAWLRDIKGQGDSNHKTVSRWLLHKESVLMEKVITAVRGRGIFCVMAHDGIDVDPARAYEAECIFKEVCMASNLPPNVTSK